ncbi:MAG: cation:proton antiporter [Burkholderiales bacterium]
MARMQAHGIPYLQEILLFLLLAGILIPVLERLKVNTVLGFLTAGVLLGPHAMGLFSRTDAVAALAELGIMFLLFTIGLELSVSRLRTLARWVFGAGTVQVLVSTLVLGTIAWAWGNSPGVAVLLGVVLSFSSTAIVMQWISRRRELDTPLGSVSLSILLFQDLAVLPVLIMIDVMGQNQPSLGQGAEVSLATWAALALLKAVCAVVLIMFIGRKLVQPVFHYLSSQRQPDSFMALTLLCTLGIAALTAYSGLSMALGAFLAGLLLSETQYRHEIEVTIEPFKGLLLGLFFMSIGMAIDWRAVIEYPLWLPLAVIGLVLIKAVLIMLVLRSFGLGWPLASQAGLLLGQGGEFALIVIGASIQRQFMPADTGHFMLLTVSLSMLATPALAIAGQMLSVWWTRHIDSSEQDLAPPELQWQNHIIVAGLGRVGQLVAGLLQSQGISFVVIETNAALVADMRRKGWPVYLGDASRSEMLQRLGLAGARAVVLTLDQTAAALNTVRAMLREAPHVPIIARARDEAHAALLRQAGAEVVVPETLESGLQIAARALELGGVEEEATAAALDSCRRARLQ